MKLLKRLAIAVVAITAFTPVAQSRVLTIGPRVGMLVNEMHFNSTVFDGSNRAGFTGGLELEVMIPAVNIGVDASLMYARRNAEFMNKAGDVYREENISNDYLSVPINLKWKISIPLLAKVLQPYIFTGPEFAFRASKQGAEDAWNEKKTDVSWNFGVGVQLIKHLQIGASYGIGMTKVAKHVGVSNGDGGIYGRNRYWTMTAAWLF